MFSVVVAAMAAMPGQIYIGGYPPVRSTYWCPPCAPYYGVYCGPVDWEDPVEKRFKAIEKKLKALDDRMEKVEASDKKLEKDLKALSAATKKQLKDFEKKNEERLQAFEKKQEESLKAAEQKSDERLKAQAEKQEDRFRNLEQRTGDQFKNLEQRTADQFKNLEQRGGDQLKALDTKYDERFRSQEDKARALELKLLEDRMAQSLKKLEDKIAEAERIKNLEGKIEDRAKGVESKIDDRLRQTLEPLAKELQMIHEKVRMLEKGGDLGKKTAAQEAQLRGLEQKLDALELRLKGKVDVLEERLKGFDGRLQDGKQALERLIDALRKRKKEADEQGIDQLDERIRKIEGDLQDVQKLQERIRALENRPNAKRPELEIVPALRRAFAQAPAAVEPIKVSAKRALITIELPADARLFINGQLKETTGQSIRYIQTPDLDDQDDYFYQVRVDLVRGGKVLSETKRVDFRAGRQVRVSFDSFGAATSPVRTALAW